MGLTVKKALSCGCLGCLGLVVVLGVVIAVLWRATPPLEVTQSTLDREIPRPAAEAEPSREQVEVVHGLEPSATRAAGVVRLDLRDASARIVAGEPGEPIRASAEYDRDTCSLTEDFQPGAGEDDPWQYSVTFRREEASSPLKTIKEILAGVSPEVTIALPPDVPLEVIAEVKRGGAVLELDDLWLTELDLDVDMGGAEVGATRPMRAPMERIRVDVTMGGCELEGLAGASPADLDINFRMGGMELDLTGEWARDAAIRISGRMGGGEVRLPAGVRLEGVPQRSLELDTGKELPGPTLRFEVDCEQGEVEFRH
jgi:hypothetical protein